MSNFYTTTIEFNHETVSDLVVTAFEGGSNYWIGKVRLLEGKFEERPWYGDASLYRHNFRIEVRPDEDDPEPLYLTPETARRGFEVLRDKFPWHFGNVIHENADADTADAWLQCALFGDIVYG